jgi:hypothetical protein
VWGDGNGLFADAFAFFAANFLTGVANSLALVGFGRIEAADFGSELTDELLVDSFHLDLGVFNDCDAETRGDGVKEWMGAAEREVEVRAFDRCAETDAEDFEVLHEAGRHAENHILDEATGSAVEGFVLAKLGSAGDDDCVVLGSERDSIRKREVEFALGALDDDRATIHLDGYLRGKRDWFESDS